MASLPLQSLPHIYIVMLCSAFRLSFVGAGWCRRPTPPFHVLVPVGAVMFHSRASCIPQCKTMKKNMKFNENQLKSTNMDENLRTSTKIYGNLRKSTKIYENLRKSMKIYENLRKCTKIYKNRRKSWNIYENR